MKVLLDCSVLQNRHTGVENYTYNIVKHMPEGVELILLHGKDAKSSAFAGRQEAIINWPKSHFFRLVHSQFWRPRLEADIIHLPMPIAPFWKKPKGSRLIVTVHDLSPLKFPSCHPIRRRIYYKFIIRHLLCQSDIIIADSNSTRKDLIRVLGVPDAKIRVIHLATDIAFTHEKPDEKYGIKGEYILYVGTIEPRKNLLRLIDAYNALAPREKLVIVGAQGWKCSKIYSKKSPNIIFTGYVLRPDLARLYSNAKLFVYPSLYEGFGLPVLEAMACRCPVITSNTSSMPEIAGEAALYVNPGKTDEIAKAMQRLLQDNALRNNLIRKGMNHAAKFSWEKHARELYAAYEECMQMRKGARQEIL